MTSWQNYVDFMKSKGAVDEIMIVSSEDGALWAASPDSFQLREYPAQIAQEDGSEKEQIVNEAVNILQFIKSAPPNTGLRLNGGKKQQVLRTEKDSVTGGNIVYGKFPQGGSCIADAGRCILIGTFSEAKAQTSAACNDLITLMARYLRQSTWPDGDEGTVDATSGGSKTWQPFIDSMLIAKGNVSEALICSRADAKLWASTPKFEVRFLTKSI